MFQGYYTERKIQDIERYYISLLDECLWRSWRRWPRKWMDEMKNVKFVYCSEFPSWCKTALDLHYFPSSFAFSWKRRSSLKGTKPYKSNLTSKSPLCYRWPPRILVCDPHLKSDSNKANCSWVWEALGQGARWKLRPRPRNRFRKETAAALTDKQLMHNISKSWKKVDKPKFIQSISLFSLLKDSLVYTHWCVKDLIIANRGAQVPTDVEGEAFVTPPWVTLDWKMEERRTYQHLESTSWFRQANTCQWSSKYSRFYSRSVSNFP